MLIVARLSLPCYRIVRSQPRACAWLQVALQGIPGIRKVFIREAKRVIPDEAAPDGYANETEWMLDTEGVNLLEARARSCRLLAFGPLAVFPFALTSVQMCIRALPRRLAGPCAG